MKFLAVTWRRLELKFLQNSTFVTGMPLAFRPGITPRAMFALATGTIDRPFREAHTAATAFSIAAHVFVLGSIVWVVLFSVSDKLPEMPPMMAFVATGAPSALSVLAASEPSSLEFSSGLVAGSLLTT